jgi:hypothetical protein
LRRIANSAFGMAASILFSAVSGPGFTLMQRDVPDHLRRPSPGRHHAQRWRWAAVDRHRRG